jgi:hypothetical protein
MFVSGIVVCNVQFCDFYAELAMAVVFVCSVG